MWRKRQPNDGLDHELLWLCVAMASGVLGWVWLALRLPVPPCRFHALTGLPCATCGSTRAVACLLDGHLAAAFAWNPLTTVLIVITLLWMLYAAIVVVFRLPRIRLTGTRPRHRQLLAWTLLAALTANWVYLLVSWS